jgi:RNA polymerase sigma-70 factor, ECF subfamily
MTPIRIFFSMGASWVRFALRRGSNGRDTSRNPRRSPFAAGADHAYTAGPVNTLPISASSAVEGSSPSDADRAMARYAEGDDKSFAVVYGSVGPRILRFLRRLCGADDLAGDLLQETMLRMHLARAAFRPGAAVLPWSYTIARNVFLDRARAKKNAAVSLDAFAEGGMPEPAEAPRAEGEVLAKEAGQAVERALARMSDARREAFILIRFEGLSVADAAEILGASENAVKLRAFQAYEAIRAELARLEKTPAPGRSR